MRMWENRHKRHIMITAMFCMVILLAVGLPCVAWADDDEGEPGINVLPVPQEPENGLPLIIVHIDEENVQYDAAGKPVDFGTIQDMNNSQDHSVRCTGTVEVKLPEGYTGEYGDSVFKTNEDGQLALEYIRGRGNSTWLTEKKPYKIKFDKKQDFFGMGADKEWALMSNPYDSTLLKNKITTWLGEQMGFPFTPEMVPVDLVMEGSSSGSVYLGCYQISELVDIGESRLNIDKLDKDTGSDQPEAITGGYLLTLYTEDQNSDEPASTVFTTDAGVELINKKPSYDDTLTDEEGAPIPLTQGQQDQMQYIRDYVQQVEDLIMQPGKISYSDHKKLDALMDLESLADYWLINEFSRNTDGMRTSSTYFYKERNGKLAWGPLWDFDTGWGDRGLDEEDFARLIRGYNTVDFLWTNQLREHDPYFVALLEERWERLDGLLTELLQEGGAFDRYAAEVTEAQKKDYAIYGGLIYEWHGEDYEALTKDMKRWIKARQEWFGSNLDKLKKAHITVTYKVDGKVIATEATTRYVRIQQIPDDPVKKGYIFTGWYEEERGVPIEELYPEEDVVLVAKFVREDKAIPPKYLYFRFVEDWTDCGEYAMYFVASSVVPENATVKKVTWTSSDPTVAVPEGEGFKLLAPGDVTLTGTLYDGVKRSMKLHVYDPAQFDPPKAASIRFLQTSLSFQVGQVKQVRWTVSPSGVKRTDYEIQFISDDPDIAFIDDLGVIKGKTRGKTRVSLTLIDESGEEVQASCPVTIIGKTNPMKAKPKTVKIKASKLKKQKVSVKRSKAIKVTGAKGKVTYKKISLSKKKYAKKFTVNKKTGKITVGKKVKKGTYTLKVQVRAAGNSIYKPLTKTVKVKIRVK